MVHQAPTIADGYSRNDEGSPMGVPSTEHDVNNASVSSALSKRRSSSSSGTGLEHHLPNPDRPKIQQSHEGEHRNDFGDLMDVPISASVKMFAACAALNSCNLGYDIGVNTGAAKLLQDSMNLGDVQMEIFMGSLNLFAMVGALSAHLVSDTYGRRGAFVVAAVGFIVGVLILSFATSYFFLMVGRVFIGLGVGFGLAIDPIYISEIAPAKHRGELVTWSEIMTNVGIVLGFCSGLFFWEVRKDLAWRFMFGLGAVLPACMIYLALFVMPESPRWLVQKGRDDEAREILKKVYPSGFDVENIIEEIRESISREEAAEQSTGWDMILFPTPAFRRMLLVGFGIAIGQQVVGIDAIQYFLVYIIEESGVESRFLQTLILIFLGLVKLGCIVVAGIMFDKRGRRPLFYTSLVGMAGALVIISFTFLGASGHSVIAILSLAMYLAFFSLGMGPGAWLIPSEIFSLTIRAKAMSVATFLNRVAATLMSSTFLSVAHAMSWAGFFLMLAFVCMLVCLFVYAFLPETKGRSLEDMSIYFAEITGDNSILEVEAELERERERARNAASRTRRGGGGGGASESVAGTAESETETYQQPSHEEAKVLGTMA